MQLGQVRLVRAALHLVAVTVLTAGAVLATGSPSHAEAPARPDSYGGEATASAFHYVADRLPGLFPVADAFHTEIPYATTSLDSSGSATASAAPLYPGAGPLGVPALICQFGAQLCGDPFPAVPRYPFIATASYPTTPDDTADYSKVPAQSGGGATFTPAVAEAHAKQDRVEALTEAAGLSVTAAVRADGAKTHSVQHFEGSTLVVTAETTVKGIDLGGGQLHIDALRSVASAHVDGDKVTTGSATTTITGATAGGHPVTIDSTGIHLDSSGDGGAAQAQVNSALSNLKGQGIDVRLLTPTKQAKDGGVSASSGGLLITFTQEVNLPQPPIPPLPPSVPAGVPGSNGTYFGSVTLAGAGVRAFATPPLDFPIVCICLPPTHGDPTIGPETPPLTNPPLETGGSSDGQVTVPGSGPTIGRPTDRTLAANVFGLELKGARLKALALVLLGYPALMLLTAPIRTRPRKRRT